ncbi:hypothetical protein GNI_227470, partial [Gregarina niphandrodes]
VEGLTFDPKSERELDKIIDDVALRIDAERPSVGLLVEVLSGSGVNTSGRSGEVTRMT